MTTGSRYCMNHCSNAGTRLPRIPAARRWLVARCIDRLLAAFQRDRAGVRYLLIGESPYPRRASANGIAFYDAAVDSLWSEQGLSKAVNRATSLRNIVKTALLAEGLLQYKMRR